MMSDLSVAARCRESLGMHSGLIPDTAITASSSYDLGSVGPQNSRSVPTFSNLLLNSPNKPTSQLASKAPRILATL